VDGPGTVSLAYRTRRPVIVEDADSDDRSLQPVSKTLGVKSILVVPLIANGEPIGTILLAETRHVRRFSEEEVARASAVANLISPAIVNAKMFADLRRSYDALSRAQADLVTHERLAALGELSAVIAHEVRNPLAVIYNSLSSLRKLPAPTPDAKVLLDIVDDEATRLNRIVADLLDFVRPYASHPRPTNLEMLVVGAIDGARRSLPTSTAIELEISPAASDLVLDATMIQQALINLIVNAIQATPPDARIEVRARVVDGSDGERPCLSFEVADQGPGIDPANAVHIFRPFFTTKPTGTGLGLAIVHRIAEALGGKVEVKCGEGQGSIFTLTVPI
jgi:signal transduction histidine kinase